MFLFWHVSEMWNEANGRRRRKERIEDEILDFRSTSYFGRAGGQWRNFCFGPGYGYRGNSAGSGISIRNTPVAMLLVQRSRKLLRDTILTKLTVKDVRVAEEVGIVTTAPIATGLNSPPFFRWCWQRCEQILIQSAPWQYISCVSKASIFLQRWKGFTWSPKVTSSLVADGRV